MPLSSEVLGHPTGEFTHAVDARWLMAYAASIDDMAECYFDTTRQIAAHPVFPVCLEWDAVLTQRRGPGMQSLLPAELACAVHAEHDIHLLQPLRPDLVLGTTATAIAVEQRGPGAYLTQRIDTVDLAGSCYCRTYYGTLFRGVPLSGPATAIETAPPWPGIAPTTPREFDFCVAANAAHLYTEGARIWNPIHTDRAAALAANLPGLILHGTATLARAVSVLVREYLGGDPLSITRLGGRFAGMVRLGTLLKLVVEGQTANALAFRVVNPDGSDAIRRGFLCHHGQSPVS
ncbi:MAG: MaoC family dehydratase N-terminal domain-containing protein [Gammaproteobacteria bacterium]|nr:MaoC family dehydratase N-terminal domain-containing protein [Gammaproteobacteria bacterium]